MRNQPKPLSREDAERVYNLQSYLGNLREGTVVTLTYVKRDGSTSNSTGTVGEMSGRPGCDTMSVTVHTSDKGPRTINLVGVKGVLPHN